MRHLPNNPFVTTIDKIKTYPMEDTDIVYLFEYNPDTTHTTPTYVCKLEEVDIMLALEPNITHFQPKIFELGYGSSQIVKPVSEGGSSLYHTMLITLTKEAPQRVQVKTDTWTREMTIQGVPMIKGIKEIRFLDNQGDYIVTR